jgi:hypothetical protein
LPKNLYANPLDPAICCFTGLGVWLSLNKSGFENKSLFSESRSGGLNGPYVRLSAKYRDVVEHFCRPNRVGSHGTRKGAALHVTSSTTHPPPVSSVARRGEWSQGSVFDVYLLFAEPGD